MNAIGVACPAHRQKISADICCVATSYLDRAVREECSEPFCAMVVVTNWLVVGALFFVETVNMIVWTATCATAMSAEVVGNERI